MRLPDELADIWLRGEKPFPGDRWHDIDDRRLSQPVRFRPDLLEALETLHDHEDDDDQLDPEHYE